MTPRHARFFGPAALAGLLLAAGPPAPAQRETTGATLTVMVSGVRDRNGLLGVTLCQTPDGFPADASKAFRERHVVLRDLDPRARLDSIRVTFDGLPPGTYAVCSLHDSNGNSRLDTNFLGAPREDWAVSNDVRPRFRPPRFDEAKFTLGPGENKAISLRVRH